jgi:hypothetical protein
MLPRGGCRRQGPGHALTRVQQRISVRAEQAAVVAASLAALAVAVTAALAATVACAAAELAVAMSLAILLGDRRDGARDLIIAGRADLPLPAVQRERARLTAPRPPRRAGPIAARPDRRGPTPPRPPARRPPAVRAARARRARRRLHATASLVDRDAAQGERARAGARDLWESAADRPRCALPAPARGCGAGAVGCYAATRVGRFGVREPHPVPARTRCRWTVCSVICRCVAIALWLWPETRIAKTAAVRGRQRCDQTERRAGVDADAVREEGELKVIERLVRASHAFARAAWDRPLRWPRSRHRPHI